MGERIELPQQLTGDEQNQLKQLWSYLYQMAENLNIHLDAIGGNELTDDERKIMRAITTADGESPEYNYSEMETLKSLIIKTAEFVQTSITEWRTTLLGETVAEGKFGRYVRQTGLDVAVNPEGITQNYSFQEIIQGLKVYEINAKNYIKSGLLRTVNSVPVYGVAIGKDIVTFSESGVETYNDGNKVAELTADELSFWQGGYKVASYTGNKITFYYGNTEALYIQNGKMYCAGDFEILSGNKLKIGSGGVIDIDTSNFKIDSETKEMVAGDWTFDQYGIKRIEQTSLPSSPNIYRIKFFNSHLRMSYELQQYGESGGMDFGPCGRTYTDVQVGMQGSISFGNKKGVIGASNSIVGEIWVDHLIYWNLHAQSSRSMKKYIKQIKDTGGIIDKLRPVSYQYKNDEGKKKRFGLIWEETVDVLPEICVGKAEDRDEIKGIQYIELIPILLKEIQDLRKRVAELERR